MMKCYGLQDGGMIAVDAPERAVWVDLFAPDDAERAVIGDLLGFAVPTRAAQAEIELSARLYMLSDTAVMTALIPAHTKTDQAEVEPITFIMAQDRLVTIRHHDPRPFTTFPEHARTRTIECSSPSTVLLGLFEEIIDRLADLTEYAGRKIEQLTASVFDPAGSRSGDLRKRLFKIGWRDALVTHIRDCLVTIERLLGFLGPLLEKRGEEAPVLALNASHLRDVRTLSEQIGFLMQKTAFLLDAMMGLINIEENEIVKLFSVVATVFLPPTLIASIYGMNFQAMPELAHAWGYPSALLLMLISAGAPLVYFKRKGWF